MLLERPENPDRPFFLKKLPAATSLDQRLPVQYIYIKLFLSAKTIQGRLNALEKRRFRNHPEQEFEDKRRILVGRDLSITFTRDMLAGLPIERINKIAHDVNDAQKECFTGYCHRLGNGIGLIHGPGGTGQTMMVAKLAESAAGQGRSVLIVTSQNSAADSAIEKLKESKYMVVRAHSLGLEQRTLLQPGDKAKESSDESPDHTQQQKPSLTSSDDLTTEATTADYTEDLMMRVTGLHGALRTSLFCQSHSTTSCRPSYGLDILQGIPARLFYILRTSWQRSSPGKRHGQDTP